MIETEQMPVGWYPDPTFTPDEFREHEGIAIPFPQLDLGKACDYEGDRLVVYATIETATDIQQWRTAQPYGLNIRIREWKRKQQP